MQAVQQEPGPGQKEAGRGGEPPGRAPWASGNQGSGPSWAALGQLRAAEGPTGEHGTSVLSAVLSG